ncbi:hypothetical protein LCGC14_1890840 [marine sediment metagenome]|uniref:Uncharacterized protein n=1 Tax=marine sediment metagenome TaxID=412755 RepID=A0A0F9IXR2_9ZZZZ
MSAGKQGKKAGKGVPAAGRQRSVPEERVSAGELDLEASDGDAASVGRGAPASATAEPQSGGSAGAPADPQSAGRSGEKPQSEPRSGDPLDPGPSDSGAPGDAKPLKSLMAAAGDAEGKVGLAAAVDVIAEQIGEAQAVAESQPQGRGPGRPPGARNRRTDEWVDYLLARYRSPLIVLAEMYSRSVGELVKEVGCTKLEAIKLQIFAAEKLAPFVHQKQPLAIQVDAHGVVRLVIEGGLPGGGGPTAGPAGEGEGVREEVGGVMVLEGQVIEGSGAEDGDE